LTKNCAVAECGSLVRAIATVPRVFLSPLSASFWIGGCVGFFSSCWSKPPPWIMNVGITRWNTVPS